MGRALKIGARPSLLALKQVREIQSFLPGVVFETVTIETKGDRDKLTPLAQLEGSDFFTREIEGALLDFKIDAAVHSAKDMEEKMPPGLCIAAVTASLSPYECFVSNKWRGLDELPPGAKVGTSSRRRTSELLRYRGDIQPCDVRGDIEQRIRKLDEGLYDGLIVAHAALLRLGLQARAAQIIPEHIIAPHPLQGCLAVQARALDGELISLFSRLNTYRKGEPGYEN